jgi:competence protein ComEA
MPDKIDLNAASSFELSQLIGIDTEVAERIIEHRARFGGFRTLEELAQVPGVDGPTLARVREHLTVG